MSGVRLTNIDKSYGAFEAVKDVSLEVADQEFVVLVGPSGCGKSTTLRMIAGLEEITGGALHIGDRLVNNIAPKDRDVAMVFQNYALYPHLNVADNISFGLNIRKVPKAEIKKQVADVAEILELSELLHRRPSELSGGQRQRVAMGRAIVRDPAVFLFDEPLSNLDAKLRTQMRAEIKKLHKRLGATSVYVTHDQVEAMTLADRIVVMQDGRIEQIGSPMELFLNPANTFVAAFLGSPPMNMVDAKIVSGKGAPVAEFGGQRLTLAGLSDLNNSVGRDVILGIRPEFVSIADQSAKGNIAVDVELVETLGSEALIHASLNGKPFVIRTETIGKLDKLDGVSGFSIQPQMIRVFDAETGIALTGQVHKQ